MPRWQSFGKNRLPSRLVLLIAVLICPGQLIADQWNLPVPHLPGLASSPKWIQMTNRNGYLVIQSEGTNEQGVGQWQGLQPQGNAFRASTLTFSLELAGLGPANLIFSSLVLQPNPSGIGWQLTAHSLVVNNPLYEIKVTDLTWNWNRQGRWQGRIGRIHLRVPLQTPIINPVSDSNISWRLLELVSKDIKGQGNSEGWQGQIGLSRLVVPIGVREEGNSRGTTIYGQGQLEPLQVIVANDGRFSVSNPGGLIDRGFANWLLGRDPGTDLQMKPLQVEGIATPAGLKMRTRNLLPWLDLWFGETGVAARLLKANQLGADTVIELRTKR